MGFEKGDTLYMRFIIHTVFHFLPSSKILSKIDLHKNIFGQTKLNENNFTSRVWWALIEEITPCAEEMAGEKEIVFVLEATTYTCIYGQQQFVKCWCVVRTQPKPGNFLL